MPSVKEQLYQLCREYLDRSISEAKQAIGDAREASANETKSSAGDKYETSREMMQQEMDMNTFRISGLQKMKVALDMINPLEEDITARAGSIVHTSQGNYYISISVGKLIAEGVPYFTLTNSAPLGARLMGKKVDDKFTFNGKEFIILKVQ